MSPTANESWCEIRLLAVEKTYRHTRISQRLFVRLVRYALDRGHDLAVISGTVREIKLYEHLRFTAFGPLAGSVDAHYQPMFHTLEGYSELKRRSRSFAAATPGLTHGDGMPQCLLPGPVDMAKRVNEAWRRQPCSHRGDGFVRDFQRVRSMLCGLFHTEHAEIMIGAGTLANDAVAGQLSLLAVPGVILVDGEFGRRLVKNAKGAGLFYHTLEVAEGETFAEEAIDRLLNRHPDIEGLWTIYLSGYLLARNWIQVCGMGAGVQTPEKFIRLLEKELAHTGSAKSSVDVP